MIAIYTFFPYAIEQYRKHRNLSAKQSLVPRIFHAYYWTRQNERGRKRERIE